MAEVVYKTRFMNEFEEDKEMVASFLEEAESYSRAIENAASEEEVRSLAEVVNEVLELPQKWRSKGCHCHALILKERLGGTYSLRDTIEGRLTTLTKKRKKRVKPASEVIAAAGTTTIDDEVEAGPEEGIAETEESGIEGKIGPKPKIIAPQMRIVEPKQKKIVTPGDLELYSTFPDVVKYFESKGIAGEKDLFVLMALCVTAGESFGVEGDSGSGKSFITNPLIDLFSEDMKCVLGLMSDTAIFRICQKVNRSWIKYIPELQKVITRKTNNPTLEYIKNFSEGRETTRTVSKPGGEGVIEYTLNAEGMMIYTLARQNAFKKDVELGRRMLVLYTDDSKEHKQERKRFNTLKRNGGIKIPPFSRKKTEELARSLLAAMAIETGTNDSFAEYTEEFVPDEFSTGIAYSEHIYNLEDGCCQFNASDRIEHDGKLHMALADKYIIGEFYLPHFFRAMLEICQDKKQRDDIQSKMEKKQDWQKCWDIGIAKMREMYPEIADDWIAGQAKEGVIAVYNPAKKETIEIARVG